MIGGLKEQVKNLDKERKRLLEEAQDIKVIKIKMGKVCEEFNQMKRSLEQSQKVELTKMVKSLRKKIVSRISLSLKKREMGLGYELDKYKKFLKVKERF